MAKTTAKPRDLVSMITGATQSDLDAITETIADLDKQIIELKSTRSSLCALRRSIGARLNGGVGRRRLKRASVSGTDGHAGNGSGRSNGAAGDRPTLAFEWVVKQNRRCKASEIAKALDIPTGSIAAILKRSGLINQEWSLGNRADSQGRRGRIVRGSHARVYRLRQTVQLGAARSADVLPSVFGHRQGLPALGRRDRRPDGRASSNVVRRGATASGRHGKVAGPWLRRCQGSK